MITLQLMERLFPTTGLNPRKYNLVRERAALVAAMNRILPKYGIDKYLRLCAFLSNCGIETDYFRTTTEYASGWDYDVSVNPRKARSLGNFKKGDGPRYKGSGLSQTTGGFNFAAVQKAIGSKLGIDVVKNPEILRENIDVAVESACIFWKDNNLNHYADRGLFQQLSGIVNRGDKDRIPLHWAKRNELYSLCKRRVPADFSFAASLSANKIEQQIPAVQAISAVDSDLLSQLPEPAEILPLAIDANNQPLVVTPAEIPPAPEPEKSKLRELSEKYLRHCPQDTAKNICVVVGGRVTGSISTVWMMGLSGRILLIVAGISLIGFSAYALYYYSPRIFGWVSDVADSVTPN